MGVPTVFHLVLSLAHYFYITTTSYLTRVGGIQVGDTAMQQFLQ